MAASKILADGDVRALRAAASQFGAGAAARKAALLARGAASAIVDADVLLGWHDCLLYLLAYPESRALHQAARTELRRVAGIARGIVATGPARARRRLTGSGIAATESTFAFGWDVVRWLASRFPRAARIDSFDDEGARLSGVLPVALPPLEFALFGADDGADALLDAAGAGRGGSRLAWLVAQFERLRCSDAVRAALFDALGLYVTIRHRDSSLSRTFVRGLPRRTFYHRDGLVRNVDLPALLREPLPPARQLSAAERQRAIDAACAMLASLGRETDAIALAYPGGVEWHEFGRGISVALYAMRADRRDPLDSHVGMMLFKNGLPVGYGGGWPFMRLCRIGINIFAPYRGGESALLFAQVLRVYCRRFGIRRFVVEPSQFGGTNREGLRSGAFWFYYRLGFRPVDASAAARANAEFARMRANPDYRTPIPALRRCTDSDLELVIGDDDGAACEPAHLSEAVTAWIRRRFGGDRTAAEATAARTVARALGVRDLATWREPQRRAFDTLAPLIAQIPGLARWPGADRRALVALIRDKGGNEFRFHARLRRHLRLRAALAALAAPHG